MKKNVIVVASVLLSVISLTSIASEKKDNSIEYSNNMNIDKNRTQNNNLNDRVSFLENENAKRVLKERFERQDADKVHQENLKSLKSK
jgi:hypothetical protein